MSIAAKRGAGVLRVLSVLTVGVVVSTHSVAAADFGGDCCADLEERIAELEATTARKGNRKVSLTIAGQIAHQITYWDDGVESNTYVTGAGSPTHLRMQGIAQISPGWSAGYTLHLELFGRQRYWVSQDTPAPFDTDINILKSHWFLQSDRLGKLSLGRIAQASDDAPILIDSSGSAGPANWVVHDGSGFFLLHQGERIGMRWGDIAFCHHIEGGFGGDCNGATTNAVRYDTPTFHGFVASASWGQDDFWDTAINYAGTISDFKVQAVAAYSENKDVRTSPIPRESKYLQLGAYLEHLPTGLFGYAAYGAEWNDHPTADGNAIPKGTQEYYKAGLRRKWLPLGHTVVYGEYSVIDDMMSERLIDSGATGSRFTRAGAGIVQEIDAAAMSIWLKYRRNTGDIKNFNGMAGQLDVDSLDFIGSGAIIRF
ncbi:porin [Hyphomicrobium sp.]|uniref:porin n=1 Tax=Hyphomicrobium sp. TaxID=82 RepID=UPI002FDCE801